jgi:hypothetical protein
MRITTSWRFVVACASVVLAVQAIASLGASMGGCTGFDELTGACSASGSIDGSNVNLGASQDIDGSSANTGDGSAAVDDSSGDAGVFDPSVLRYDFTCQDPVACAAAAVHLSDLISFHPAEPTTGMEPAGWAIVKLDANFLASAGTDIQNGTLLGQPAQVRFTPSAFHWDYGDGTTRTSDDGGSTWAQLGIPEFSPTSTSHAYLSSGSFTVHVSTTYTAEYRFANLPWQAIPGSLNESAPEFVVVVGTAKTVLVDQDCLANPNGPGC